MSVASALDAHCRALADCRRCGHDERSVLPVVSASRRPRAMLVGQAPGQTEAVDRRPFSGRAGRTLFRWLARAGLSEARAREQLYISAVTRCYPGPHPSGRGDRVATPRERALCASWLDAELRIIRPPLLILVGRLAIDRFLEPAPLDQLVGRALDVAYDGAAARAVPLPHPSGASSWIHAPGHAALVEGAIGLLAAEFSRLGFTLDVVPGERSVA